MLITIIINELFRNNKIKWGDESLKMRFCHKSWRSWASAAAAAASEKVFNDDASHLATFTWLTDLTSKHTWQAITRLAIPRVS